MNMNVSSYRGLWRYFLVLVLVLVLRESVKTQEGRGEPIGPGLDNPAVVGRLALSCTSGSALSGPEGG